MPDDDLEDALRDLSGYAQRTSRVDAAADIIRRADRRRRRRYVTTTAVGAALIAGLGYAVITNGLFAAPAIPSASTAPTARPSAPRTTPATAPPTTNPILKGERQIAIVRVQATESAVSLLDNGELAEVDDDSGKTLFVLSPLNNGKYLIRTAELDKATNGSQACWKVHNPDSGGSLTVRKAACDPDDTHEQFTITAEGKENGKPAYAISNSSAFLQASPTSGLILEELGDASLTTTFAFPDNGAAPAVD
jgi:hypothetical protein